MDIYQQFIHKSRYARYLPDKKRREHWPETVSRYFDYIIPKTKELTGYDLSSYRDELENAVLNQEVMPSMRGLMTAGKALDRNSTCLYNCAYLPIDDPKAFDEAMFILMCGTGVGFSVERQYVNKLPEIPEKLFDSDVVITIKDSKEGWAKGLRMLIALLYSGEIPTWDLSKLRPAGARLKTFGGRSSGPGPLDDLFKFVVATFKVAQGRKLTSLECHDIMCKIGSVIVSGGVRRSALISLSNLSDDRMRNAKSGNWWETHDHRTLSNNSAVYTEKPDVDMFLEEWLAIYRSKSGERGIFNREAANFISSRNGRRKTDDIEWGTNPCSEIILRPYEFCNLCEVIVRGNDSVKSLKQKIRIATILGTIQSCFTDFGYLRKNWKKNCEEERLLGVSLTGILDNKLLNDYKNPKLPELLELLKETAVETNKEFAEKLGIPVSAAITAVKPSGTVSALCGTASGIHPRHSPYYFRRIRNAYTDPLTDMLIKAGVPNEPDVTQPLSTCVFTFPMRSPDNSLYKSDLSALDHLNLWLIYQKHWTEHKPSVTISVKDHEWPSVGAWVWDNFDWLSGVSFLPYDGGIYRQAPFEEISKEQYESAIENFPKSINWDELIEADDETEGVQMLACSAGCEL